MPNDSAFDHPTFRELAENLEDPCLALSKAIRDAGNLLMPEDSGPRSWGRRLSLDKDLAWKAYRIAQATDTVGVLSKLPGTKGLELLEDALRRSGCPSEVVDRLHGARTSLQERLTQAGLDRQTLCAIAAGGLDSPAEVAERRRNRAAARRAAALMWGVEADAGLPTFLAVPSRTPGFVDLAFVNLIEGFRRLRPGQPWCVCSPIFNFETAPGDVDGSRHDESVPDTPEVGVRLVADDPLEPLIGELTDPIARAEIRRHPSGRSRSLYYHGEGVPPTHRMRLAFGEAVSAAGPMSAPTHDEIAALQVGAQLPIAEIHFGVLFHRDLRRRSDPNAALFATLDSTGRRRAFEEPIRLPLDREVEPMRFGEVPKRLHAAAADYSRLLGLAATTLDASPADFTSGFRISARNPPQLSTLSLRWRLAPA